MSNVSIASFRKQAVIRLGTLYDQTEAYRILDILLEEHFSYSSAQLHMHRTDLLSAQDEEILEKYLTQLLTAMPLQYLLGKAWFFDLKLKVSPATLIPRPETEELVNWIVEENLNKDDLHILDIGTGSACIALSLKKFMPYQEVYATDISKEALVVAEQNADLNKLPIHFFEGDILDKNYTNYPDIDFDIIVSNPPYIKQSEQLSMHANVLKFEPALALFVADENALLFYEAIVDFIIVRAKKTCKVYFEINEALGEAVKQMLKERGFQQIALKQDLYGKDRMIRAIWKL